MSVSVLMRRIGGRYALSGWSVILPLVLLVPLRLVDLAVSGTAHGAGYLLATVAGMGVVAIGALAARATYLPATPRAPRPVLALATFFALGVARVVAVAGTEHLLGLPPSRPMPLEALIGGVQGMLVLAAIAAWVTSQRQARATRAELRTVQQRVRTARLVTEVRSDEVLRALVADVWQQVQARLSDGPSGGADTTRIARALRDVSEDYVRPLSHRLRAGQSLDLEAFVRDTGDPVMAPQPHHPSARQVAARLAAPNPWVVTGVMLVLGAGTSARLLGTMATLVLLLAFAPVMLIGSMLVGRAMERGRGHPVALPAVLLIGHAAVAGTAVIAGAGAVALLTGPAGWRIPTVVTFTFVAGVVSLAGTASSLQEESERELADRITEEAVALDAASAHLARLRAVAEGFLHGSVQSELVAPALMLQTASGPSDPDAVVDAVHQRMHDAIALAGARASRASAESVRAQLGFWSGAVSLSWTVDDRCWPAFDRNPDVVGAVTTVVAEAITNAIRHGDAQEATLTIDPGAGDSVVVCLRTAGHLPRPMGSGGGTGSGTGLGLRKVAELSDRWSLTDEDGRVVLRACVSPADPSTSSGSA